MYTEYYDLFERFCIMTIDGKLNDKVALERLKTKTTKELYSKLENWSKII